MWLVILLLCVLCVPAAWAQSEEIIRHGDQTAFTLHIPDIMIAGDIYEGVIITKKPQAIPQTINLASDNRHLEIPTTVTIHPGQNHVIFPIHLTHPRTDTAIRVHAITPEHRDYTDTTIFSISNNPTSLHIITPAQDTLTTATDTLPAKVMLTDAAGIPVITKNNVTVRLTATPDIRFSQTISFDPSQVLDVMIPAGQYETDFIASITGDGQIHAHSESLTPDSVQIEYVASQDITIHIAITPIPAAAYSSGSYFVWLERDGIMYVPQEVITVKLESSGQSVRFTNTIGVQEVYTQIPPSGIQQGIVYFGQPTQGENPASVTATIPGIGTGSAQVIVHDTYNGAAQLICLWYFPPIPSSIVWISAGFYAGDEDATCVDTTSDITIEDTENLTVSNSTEKDKLKPIRIHNTRLDDLSYTSSMGHDDHIAILDTLQKKSPATYISTIDTPFKILDHREHYITVTPSENTAGDTTSFVSLPESGSEYVVTLSPIPAIRGIPGEIAYIVITDQQGIIRNPQWVTNEDIANSIVTQSGNAIDNLHIQNNWIGTTSTISGIYQQEVTTISAAIPGLLSDEPLYMTVTGAKTGISVWMPPEINIGSEFPVTVHALSQNRPLQRLDADSLTITGQQIHVYNVNQQTRSIITQSGNGTLNIISSDSYISSVEFSTFQNEIHDVNVRSVSPDVVRLGSNILLEFLTGSVYDPDVSILGNIDFTQDEQTGLYTATPQEPGQYQVTVLVEKDGWDDYRQSFGWEVEHMVTASVSIIADDGVSLPIGINMTHSESTNVTLHNGVQDDVRAGVYTIGIPEMYSFGQDRTYVLRDININGETLTPVGSFTYLIDSDSVVSAVYHREIDVQFVPILDAPDDIIDAAFVQGNGLYRYGDTVTVSATSVPELFGLIWHVPVSYNTQNGIIKSESISFEAITSESGYVEYEKNYTVTIAFIGIIVAAPVIVIRIKSPEIIWDLKDGIHSTIKKLKSKNNKKYNKKQNVQETKSGLFGSILGRLKK